MTLRTTELASVPPAFSEVSETGLSEFLEGWSNVSTIMIDPALSGTSEAFHGPFLSGSSLYRRFYLDENTASTAPLYGIHVSFMAVVSAAFATSSDFQLVLDDKVIWQKTAYGASTCTGWMTLNDTQMYSRKGKREKKTRDGG